MNKFISLEEAYRRAAQGTLKQEPFDTMRGYDCCSGACVIKAGDRIVAECDERHYPIYGTGSDAPRLAQEAQLQVIHTAALLTHGFNHLGQAADIIEGLIKLTQTTDVWIPVSWLDEAKAFIKKVDTVELPG